MRNEEVLVWSRQWPLTSALSAMLQAGYSGGVKALYTTEALSAALAWGGDGLVVLGLNPHEHVMLLYRLQEALAGRRVVFVSSGFYWTDYNLPSFFGLEGAGFCTEGMLHGTGLSRVTPGWLGRLCGRPAISLPVRVPRLRQGLDERVVLWWVNYWLSRRMSEAGLSEEEKEVLSDLSEGETGRFSLKRRSMLKVSGLDKLMSGRNTLSLYRGVKVRSVLQVPDTTVWCCRGAEREDNGKKRRKGRKNDERRYLRSGV